MTCWCCLLVLHCFLNVSCFYTPAAPCPPPPPAGPSVAPPASWQSIANMQPQQVPFEGIKVQLKGRMSGKSGKASKKVWEWGRTSTATISDPVDYAHDAVITRAGYISIKV